MLRAKDYGGMSYIEKKLNENYCDILAEFAVV